MIITAAWARAFTVADTWSWLHTFGSCVSIASIALCALASVVAFLFWLYWLTAFAASRRCCTASAESADRPGSTAPASSAIASAPVMIVFHELQPARIRVAATMITIGVFFMVLLFMANGNSRR